MDIDAYFLPDDRYRPNDREYATPDNRRDLNNGGRIYFVRRMLHDSGVKTNALLAKIEEDSIAKGLCTVEMAQLQEIIIEIRVPKGMRVSFDETKIQAMTNNRNVASGGQDLIVKGSADGTPCELHEIVVTLKGDQKPEQ